MKIRLNKKDYDLLKKPWFLNNYGYAVWSFYEASHKSGKPAKRGTYLMHRVILERKIGRKLRKNEATDHINGIRTDNRRCNLRVASWGKNLCNRGAQANNVCGVKGVTQRMRQSGKIRYYASIHYRGKKRSLGGHPTLKEARKAYEAAAEKYFGEFAYHLSKTPLK